MSEPGETRRGNAQKRIAAIRAAIETAKAQAVTLQDFSRDPQGLPPPREPAITLADMEKILTTSEQTRDRLRPCGGMPGAYWLDLPTGTAAVTFDRAVLDANSPDVRLLTYLTDELDELLRVARVEVPSLDNGHLPPGLLGTFVASLESDLGSPLH
jgi:hypothetical protein